jgi:2-deoxy-D-gluconate 3-dehydrogenase
MVDLQGKVAVITGSARGIGRHVAHTFADAGAAVVLADVAPLELVKDELEAKEAKVLAVPTDVQSEEAVQALMDRAVAEFGRIDVLVNNAAVVTHFLWGVPTWPVVRDMDTSFWDKVIGTNLRGTFLCTKYALPHMEAQGSGHVISTMGGGNPDVFGSCAYGVSKDAIRTFTKFVAEEERAHNVCVVMVSPGAQIATEEAPEEARNRMPGPEAVGDRFVIAATADMSLSGQVLQFTDGALVPRP